MLIVAQNRLVNTRSGAGKVVNTESSILPTLAAVAQEMSQAGAGRQHNRPESFRTFRCPVYGIALSFITKYVGRGCRLP